jgi:DNA helicase HerA-like ATPase
MSNQQNFLDTIQQGYATKGDYLLLGKAMLNHEVFTSADIRLPLRTLNRHGLIAGATGTGKTKTLQHITEGLSDKGIPVLLMDIKGDLSGLAQCGDHNPKLDERCQRMGINFVSESYPVELLTISNEKGARLRATVTEFGPILLSKILELNDTQQGVVAMLFKYCDDNGLPLLDLKDFKKVLQWMTNEGAAEIEQQYGKVSSATTSTILRKIIELEQQGAELFFGERSFDVRDLLATDPTTQQGMVHIMRLIDLQDRPKLFATFMLSLLAEIYATFPEVGDAERPKLVIFIDEAHLIFNEASKALLNQIETIIKLIRSKGVGIFFCTQTPTDVPDAILGQLGMKIQHALRAFTAKDRKGHKAYRPKLPRNSFLRYRNFINRTRYWRGTNYCFERKRQPNTFGTNHALPT